MSRYELTPKNKIEISEKTNEMPSGQIWSS
jgi:hypothetical protein